MSNLVIVAIPDENDRVWQMSSEKIPHLTLLFLGDVDAVANLEQIILFVEHAANTTLRRFSLPVDRRGELGEDRADVLFFKPNHYACKDVTNFRAALLQNGSIRTAYDSTPQFEGPWNPHLTLGYPESPAKAIPDDQSWGFYSVEFNKIAVWIDDFDGPEFLLKDYWDDFDMAEIPMDVAMSAIKHHGVKGMRWGVRKEDVSGAAKSVGRAAGSTARGVGKAVGAATRFGLDVQFENKAADGRARQEVISKATTPFKKQDLPAIKAKHAASGGSKLKTRVLKPASQEARAYRKDAREAYIKRLEEAANSTKNASGNREYTIRERGIELPAQGGDLPRSKYFWDVSTRKVQHADNFDGITTLELVMDDDGWITDLQEAPTEDALAQSDFDLGEDFVLEHFGVKGMQWGVRRNRAAPLAVAPSAMSNVPHGKKRKTKIDVEGGENHPAHDDAIRVAEARAKLKKSGTAALSNQELRQVANRLQLEAQVATLTSSRGQKFVMRELETSGQQLTKMGVRKGLPKAASAAAGSSTGKKVIKRAGKTAATAATIALL